MLSSRGFLSVAASNGALYAIGGLSVPNVLTRNELYTP